MGLLVAGFSAPGQAVRIARLSLVVGSVTAGLSWTGALLFGEPGSLEYLPLSSFLPLASILAFSATAAVLGLRGGDRRFALAMVPALAAGGVLTPSLLRSSSDLVGGDPLVALVVESQPLWRQPETAVALFGMALLLVPLAGAGVVRAWWRTRTPDWLAVAAWVCALLGAAATQARFAQPWAGTVAVLLATGLPALVEGLGSPRGSPWPWWHRSPCSRSSRPF